MDKKLISQVLSLWEVAHRWAGVSEMPETESIRSYAVQDCLRFMAHQALEGNLSLASSDGRILPAQFSMPPMHEWLGEVLEQDELQDDVARADAMERYNAYIEERLQAHRNAIGGFERVLEQDKFPKELFESRYVNRGMLIRCCVMSDIEPPEFWSTPELISLEKEWLTEHPDQEEQQVHIHDKELCRALAQTLWLQNENMLLTAVYKHPAFQQFANGRFYSLPTIRKWIRDLEPAAQHS